MIQPAAVEKVVRGDLQPMPDLQHAPHMQLLAAWEGSNKPRLDAGAVARVVDELLAGRADAAVVQSWASLMRRGYLELSGPAIHPLDIDFDERMEEAIVEAIDALDQIGDGIEGDIDRRHLAELAGRLRQGSGGL